MLPEQCAGGDGAKHSEARTLCPLCRPLMARGCFLARQDQLLGTLALTLTSWAGFDPNLNDGVRRHFEPGPDSAQCGFGRASHCEFGAFFPGAGGLHSVYGSGIPSLASPGLRIFGPFHLGSWAQDDERKSDNYYETGRWHGKKAHSRQKEGVGLPLAWYHLPRNFALVAFNGTGTS